MNIRLLVLASILALIGGVGAPAYAQTPRVQSQWEHYLSTHPELRRNPGLIFNQDYMKAHPNLNTFVLAHPSIQREVHRGAGSWDKSGAWRDSDWWHQNDPDWMYQNHPEWARNHPDWQRNDGDWDDQHRWRDRDWWMNNNRQWAEEHHPDWFKHHGKGWYKNHHEGDQGNYHGDHDDNEGHGYGHKGD